MTIPLSADVQKVIEINERPPPISLPPKIAEARRFVHWGKLSFLLVAFIFLILVYWEFITGFITGIFWHHFLYFPFGILFYGIVMLVAFTGAYMTQTTIIRLIDRGRFDDARNNTFIWMILGFIFGVLPGLMLLFAFVNFEETVAPASAPGPAPSVQASQPAPVQSAQAYVPPPPPSVVPAPPTARP